MSRKKSAPKKIPVVDPKFKSAIIPKLINSIMYDGKKTTAEKSFSSTSQALQHYTLSHRSELKISKKKSFFRLNKFCFSFNYNLS